MYLVLIETSGNQNYIFATNKLRENVGASELTYRAGTQWVLEAVAQNGGPQLWPENETAEQLRINLLNQSSKPRQGGIEVIVATSGKALLLVENPDIGKKIVSEVTRQALKEAPGLDVCGVISEAFEWEKTSLAEINNREFHEKLEEVRANRPGPVLRYQRLAIVDECQTSGVSASFLDKARPGKPAPRSQVSNFKWHAEPLADARLNKLLENNSAPEFFEVDFAQNVNWMEKHCEWLAVVHADGNGLGEIFLNFGKCAGCEAAAQNGQYVDWFRKFSIALDICTEQAFLHAAKEMAKRRKSESFTLPILPIVLGGDDLTVVCDGKDALQFTHDFLTQFELETARTDHKLVGDIIPQVVSKPFTPKRLSASAGVAIIKPHFPFSAAYDLAEELIISAKRVKKLVKDPDPEKLLWPCSTLDFHALYDASSSELDAIRNRLSLRQTRRDSETNQEKVVETRNYGKPYVVTSEDGLKGANGESWAQQHHWDLLNNRVNIIWAKEKDDAGNETDRRKLPNTQLHELRAGLPLGRGIVDARFNLIKQRYDLKAFKGDQPDSIYCRELLDRAKDKDQHGKEIEIETEFTCLLDAMDAADFWRKEDAKSQTA